MWPDTPKTQEMLDQAKQGEADAVERLLTTHREPLRRMIDLRLDPALAARVDASDIVQDVLLKAHRRLNDYLRNPTMPFHLWLRHIAKDHVIDAHRRHRLAQRRSLDREQPIVPAAWRIIRRMNSRARFSIRSRRPPRPPSGTNCRNGSTPPSPH